MSQPKKNSTIKVWSKACSYVLRHRPDVAGITLDPYGWTSVSELLEGLNKMKPRLSCDRELLERVVAENNKKRFEFSEDGERIRARQGHSVDVLLDLPPVQPPDRLWHGTTIQFLNSIQEQGIVKGRRNQVHLSQDQSTATAVGRRHGKVCLLEIDSTKMHAEGFQFYCTANHVWLTDYIPPEFIKFPSSVRDHT